MTAGRATAGGSDSLWGRRRRCLRSRRGAEVILATILMIAIVVVLAAAIFILVKGYLAAPSTGPNISGSLVLGNPNDAVSESNAIAACRLTACNFSNITVQSAGGGLELHNLALEVQSSSGTVLMVTGGVVAENSTGGVVGAYNFTTGWSSGSTVSVASHLTLVLYTSGATPTSLFDDYLIVYGSSGFTGSLSVHIY